MRTKKRLLCLILALALTVGACPCVRATVGFFFVAVNDSVPLTLMNLPYESSSGLLVPYTVFDARPGGVLASYNEAQQALYLLNKDKMLCFDMTIGTVIDENLNESPSAAIYRDGIVFVPLQFCASYFGLGASLLESTNEYPVLRFTTGSQVYDDATFMARADGLLNTRVQQYLDNLPKPQTPDASAEQKPEQPPEQEPVEPVEPEKDPSTVYLALENAQQMAQACQTLTRLHLRAACFVTEQEIRDDPELIRTLWAAGFPLGLTVPEAEENAAQALRRANDALDEVLQLKSVMVLLTPEQAQTLEQYRVFVRPAEPISADEAAERGSGSHLFICGADFSDALYTLRQQESVIRALKENTVLP